MNEVKDTVRKLISEKMGRDLSEADLAMNFEHLGLNSLEYIQMIVLIEEQFGIKFSDDILFKGKDCSTNEFSNLVASMLSKKENEEAISGNKGTVL